MAAGEITFIKCPQGDSFPVQKTSNRSSGPQQIVCPRCGHSFEVALEETVERPSLEPKLGLRMPVTRFA
jgi:transposase-like protein